MNPEKVGTWIGGIVLVLLGVIVCLGLLWIIVGLWQAVFG